MTFNPLSLYQRLIEVGNAFADAKYKAELADKKLRINFARWCRASDEKTVSGRENEVLASNEYEKAAIEVVELNYIADKAKADYMAAQAYVELMRTHAANERAANKHAT